MSSKRWIMTAFCLLLSAPLGLRAEDAIVAAEANAILSPATLRDLLATEIKERLSRSARFVLLPNNISRIHVSAGSVPVFVMSAQEAYKEPPLTTALESLARDYGSFRLMLGANVAGMSENGEVVIVGTHDSENAVVGPTGTRPTGLPNGLAILRAFRIGGRWFYQTADGLLDETATSVPQGTSAPSRGAIRIETEDGLLTIHPNEWRREGERAPLVIEFRKADGVERQTFTNVPIRGIQGAVRLSDGNWLAISERLAALTNAFRATPSEADLLSALEAAEKSNETAFAAALAGLTLYPAETLQGMSQLLIALPDPASDLREVEGAVQKTFAALDRRDALQDQPVGRQGSKELNDAVANYRTDARALLDAIRLARGNRLLPAPATVAMLLGQGYQYFDGWWIARPRLLGQHHLDEAYLVMTYADERTSEPRQGLFVVRADGRLHLLDGLAMANAVAAGNPSVVPGGKDCDWLFMPGSGLARIADGTVNWVDRSTTMKAMSSLLGCDTNGLLYFSQPNILPIERSPASQALFWVYNPDGKPSEEAEMSLIPTTSLPIVDTLGRIWFIHEQQYDRSSRGEWSDRRASDGASFVGGSPLGQATLRPLTWPRPDNSADLSGAGPAGLITLRFPRTWNRSGRDAPIAGDLQPTLYCYADGQLENRLTDPAMRSATLLAGSDGAILVVPPSSSAPTLIIDKDAVVAGADLHTLAETNFDLLLRCAPERSISQADQEFPKLGNRGLVSICRAGGMLWICQGGRSEVYRNGQSLLVNKRLTLLSAPSERNDMLGPLACRSAGMLFITRPESVQDIFWATADEEGIKLERAMEPPKGWLDGGTLTDPGHLASAPLLNSAAGKVYYYNGFDRVWESTGPQSYAPLYAAGQPTLITRDGNLVVYRYARTFRGYRVVGASSAWDIKPTYARQLRVAREEGDGRLMCLGPEGVVWLRPGKDHEYVVDKMIPISANVCLSGYLAENDREIAFLAVDRDSRICIVVWRKNR